MTSAPASSLHKDLHDETSPVSDPFHKFLGAQLINKAKGSGSSRFRAATHEPLEKLPLLRGIPQNQFDISSTCLLIVALIQTLRLLTARIWLFRKLRQCSLAFDFTDPLGDLKVCHRMHPIISISHGICSVSVVEEDQAGSTD